MQRIIRFLVFSDVWVGVAVASFTWLTFISYSHINWIYIMFTFFSTVASYNYMRIVQIPNGGEKNKASQKFWMQQRIVQALFFTVVFSIIALYLYVRMFNWHLFFVTLLPVVISVLYPLSFKYPLQSFTSLRAIPGIKVLLIAFCWAYVTQLAPVLIFDSVGVSEIIEFIMRILLITALVIPFDIRDIRIDEKMIRTLPQILGIKKARRISILLISAFICWKITEVCFLGADIKALIAWVLGLLITIGFVRGISLKKSEIYTGFWIEASPIYVMIILVLLNYI